MSEHAIEVHQITKRYGAIQALNGVSFNVRRGEIFALLGPNGAGKTTTLSIIEGIRQADGGSVQVLGMDMDTHARQIKRRIGVQLQTTSLLPDLPVADQMWLFGRLYGVAMKRSHVLALLELFGLREQAHRLPDHLSGGQRQRLALAIALVNDPEILVLDEPTSGLDPQSRRMLWDIIRKLRDEGRTIVLTTHYMEEAATLAHRVGIIEAGKLLALGTPGELIKQLHQSTAITLPDIFPVEVLAALPAIVEIKRESGRVVLYTYDEPLSYQALMELARERGLALNDVRIQPPTLEDVFLQLTGYRLTNDMTPTVASS
ncbi:ABC transporter ATP-binding protein [Chloroflexus sp.]|uniref:ABC transporter ATP-binding protein n=1 Tax=Chloroflexus sp. TaxID=1904827 RepID=UPI00298ED459|nr:ABC transporter ATP-binding protein [Chloroflexus sp.]MDW8405325.1 ABC transporter ATP-binding protein [Chloroflexus sp.]